MGLETHLETETKSRDSITGNCARRYFVKSKFSDWHPLICFYESTYVLLVDFDLLQSVTFSVIALRGASLSATLSVYAKLFS